MYNHDEDDNGKMKSLFCFSERDTAAIVITSIQVKMTLKTTIFIFVECSDKRIVIHITKKFNPFLFMCIFIYKFVMMMNPGTFLYSAFSIVINAYFIFNYILVHIYISLEDIFFNLIVHVSQ